MHQPTLDRIQSAVRRMLRDDERLPAPSIWAMGYPESYGITDVLISNIYVEERLALRQPSEAEGD